MQHTGSCLWLEQTLVSIGSLDYEQKITLAVNLSPFSQLTLEIRIYFQAQFHACLSDGYKEDFSHNVEFETFSK